MIMPDLQDYIRDLDGPVMVTGASGFIGANLFKILAAVRDDVYAIVNCEKNWRLYDVNDNRIVIVDLNNYASTKDLVDRVKPKTVFDLVAYGAYSFEEDTELTYQTNFNSIVNFISLLAKNSFSAYIHAGSSSEYGTNSSAPTEEELCKPNSPYAVSKVAVASYLKFMGKHRNFPCVNLRLYSVYGPLEDTSRLMPNLIRQALSGKFPPLVHQDITHDFIHVDDVCAAFIMSAAKMHHSLFGEDFNIGTGIKTTIGELAEISRNLFNLEIEPKFGTMVDRAWDLSDWYSDPQKANEQLGWKSLINLEDGMRSMASWVGKLSGSEMTQTSKINNSKPIRSVSAIIACYKDGQAIPIMYRRLTDVFCKLGIDYEIIFVNDCSPDESAQTIIDISAMDPNVIGISHSRNFGSQMAFRSGMELSTKDCVVLLDGDLQDPPELIESFYAKWEEGYDVVYGRRTRREMPWYLGIMHKLFYRIFAMFSYVTIPLDAGDFSLMDRRVVGWIINCPERDLFIRGIRAYVGFKQIGVDYVRPKRMFGRTTNSLMKNIAWVKKGIFSFSNSPLTMLTNLGFMLLGLSILSAIVLIVLRLLIPSIAPSGVTTLLVTILMFGSLNLFAIALVGEYIAKILEEVKRRPRLIRNALIRNGKVNELFPSEKSKRGT